MLAPEVQPVLDELSLGHRGTARAPLYIYEGTFGEVMPLNAVNNMYDIYCHNRAVYSGILDPGAVGAFVNTIGQTLASALGMPV